MSRAIAIDFDGTLCENKWPEIGEPNWNVINCAKAEKEHGAELILLTMREGELLEKALSACKKWGLTFNAVNDNLESWKSEFGNNPRKIGATEYWDDRAVNVDNIPHWIPCSEKMPEDCLSEREMPTRVQIRCILSSGKRVFFGSRTRYGTDKKWFWNRGSNITHWMPLPQPPKEEQ